METKEIIRTKINLIQLGVFFLATSFFGYLAIVVLNSNVIAIDGSDENDSQFVKWILFVLFICFSISCLYNILSFKIYSLTQKYLIVNQPLLLLKKVFPIETIDNIIEINTKMNMSRGLQNVASYRGKVTIIKLLNGEKIKFDSSTINNYSEFKKHLSERITC